MIHRPLSMISLFVFLTAVLWVSGASGFETCKTTGLLDMKWSNPSVTYKINISGGPVESLTAIQAGMQTWTDVGTASLALVYGGTTPKTSANYGFDDGENIVVFGPMGQNGTLAQNTSRYNPSTGYIFDSDIQINTSYSWNTTGAAGYYDVQNVGTHELGHSLCLKDLYSLPDSGKTMYGYAASGETKKRTLDQDDIDGITYLYPAPDIVVSPLNIAFGSINVGSSSSQTVVVTNNGVVGLTIGTVASLSQPFSIETDLCSGRTLAPEVETCSITVRFAPTSGDIFGGNLNIPSNDPDQNPLTVGLSGTGLSSQYTLSISKTGTDTGTVTSTPAGINCGSDCTEAYNQNTVVTLSASPGVNSTFTGWSGGGCNNTGACVVTMTGNTTVTATFAVLPPVANFIGSPATTGGAPLAVIFTDLSSNSPTSWSWTFGDGETSAEQNPLHNFKTPGTYSVSLSATNSGGTASLTKTNFITVAVCSIQPVRIAGTTPIYYAALPTAYSHVADGGTIEAHAVDFTENLNFDLNRAIQVTLKGGYGCNYALNPAQTTILGSLTVSDGTLIIENIAIR